MDGCSRSPCPQPACEVAAGTDAGSSDAPAENPLMVLTQILFPKPARKVKHCKVFCLRETITCFSQNSSARRAAHKGSRGCSPVRGGYFSPPLFHMSVGEKTKLVFLRGYGYGTALIPLTRSLGLALSSFTDGRKARRWVPDPTYAGLTCSPAQPRQRQPSLGWWRHRLRGRAAAWEGVCCQPTQSKQPALQVRSALLHSKQGGRCLQAAGLRAAILKRQTHKHLTPASLAGDGK